MILKQGESISIPRDTFHAIKAKTNIQLLEVQIGSEISNKDKKIENYNWNEVSK